MNSLINDVTVKLVMSLIDDSSRPKTYISDKAKAPNNLTRRSWIGRPIPIIVAVTKSWN